MLLIENGTGKVVGSGCFSGDAPEGFYYVDGPYVKGGEVVTNVAQVEEEIRELFRKKALSSRSEAYKLESDSLYLEWQFDQTEESEQVWRDKVTEIKARYPLI